MRQYVCKNFNPELLLSQTELDIKRASVENTEITADEYFDRLERFVTGSQRFVDALRNLPDAPWPAKAAGGFLLELKGALEQFGYYKLSTDFTDLSDLVGTGSPVVLGRWSAYLCNELEALFTGLRAAQQKTAAPAVKNDDSDEPPVLLSEAVEYFYHTEATRPLRILVVDDVFVILNKLVSILTPHYEVVALTKASHVAKTLESFPAELFLLDIDMPEMSGYDLVSVIRNFPEHKDTPIIFIASSATTDCIKMAVTLGAADFMIKPVDREKLLSRIENCIVKKTFIK